MKIKSYFSRSVEDAIAMARRELGPEAMLVNSRRTGSETQHLGAYEVVFADTGGDPLAKSEVVPDQPAVADRIAAEMAELKKQLESMRHTLTRSAFAPAQLLGAAPELSEAYALLTAHEVTAELASELVRSAAVRGAGAAGWQTAVAQELASRIRIEPLLGAGEQHPRIVALVGPPGSGKTSTLVKLAVHYGLAVRRPVLLLSADTYRIAAAEQLSSYAAILGVGFRVLETVPALAQTINENRSKELILIDTPGLGFADLDTSSDLARFLSTRTDIDRQLVLSSSMKSADLTRVIDSYEIFRPQRLLFTRLDETSSLGPLFNEAARTGKPLSFFTTGQRIPEDLEAANHQRLIQSILGALPEAALCAA